MVILFNLFQICVSDNDQQINYRPPYFDLTFYTIFLNKFGDTLGQFIMENCSHFLDDFVKPVHKIKTGHDKLLEILNFINHSQVDNGNKR